VDFNPGTIERRGKDFGFPEMIPAPFIQILAGDNHSIVSFGEAHGSPSLIGVADAFARAFLRIMAERM
jgi:hypothetical protein